MDAGWMRDGIGIEPVTYELRRFAALIGEPRRPPAEALDVFGSASMVLRPAVSYWNVLHLRPPAGGKEGTRGGSSW